MSDLEDATPESQPPRSAATSPRWLWWASGFLLVATLLGAALSPYLAVHHPLWLIALNPWPRHQILVAPQLAFVPFVALVSLRGLLSCIVAYQLGKHYGSRGTAYVLSRSPDTGRVLLLFEQLFGRFSSLLLVLAPGLMTSALAGMSGVTRLTALMLSLIGLCAWASLNHHLGAMLAPWTAPLLAFLREHMLATTAICTLFVLLYQAWSQRQQRAHVRRARATDLEKSASTRDP